MSPLFSRKASLSCRDATFLWISAGSTQLSAGVAMAGGFAAGWEIDGCNSSRNGGFSVGGRVRALGRVGASADGLGGSLEYSASAAASRRGLESAGPQSSTATTPIIGNADRPAASKRPRASLTRYLNGLCSRFVRCLPPRCSRSRCTGSAWCRPRTRTASRRYCSTLLRRSCSSHR
jgi:hypothetical protein